MKKLSPLYLILDATAIIHFFTDDFTINEGEILVIPEIVKNEIKSRDARMVLDLMETDHKVIYDIPSSKSSKKVIKATKQTGDFNSLSKQDLSVLAIALDYPQCKVITDDYAVQNVCSYLHIPFDSYSFKIAKLRKYFWKCVSCGTTYSSVKKNCIECGSKLKRYFETSDD